MRFGLTLLGGLIRATSACSGPGQVALGVTVGVWLGLLPKTSLLFCLSAAIAFWMPAHLLALIATASLVSAMAWWAEPQLSWLGLWSLTHPRAVSVWQPLGQLPLVPWLGIQNTLVHGSCITAFALMTPTFVVSKRVAGIALEEWDMRPQTSVVPAFAITSTNTTDYRQYQELRPSAGQREPGQATLVEPPVVVWDTPEKIETTSDVIRRASDLADWADDAIAALLNSEQSPRGEASDKTTKIDSHVAPQAAASPIAENMDIANGEDPDEKWLIETTLEFVRIAEETVSQKAYSKTRLDPHMTLAAQGDLNTVKDTSVRREPNGRNDQHVRMDSAVTKGAPAHGLIMPHDGKSNQPREEALHYLLRHLKGIQEKVRKQ